MKFYFSMKTWIYFFFAYFNSSFEQLFRVIEVCKGRASVLGRIALYIIIYIIYETDTTQQTIYCPPLCRTRYTPLIYYICVIIIIIIIAPAFVKVCRWNRIQYVGTYTYDMHHSVTIWTRLLASARIPRYRRARLVVYQ